MAESAAPEVERSKGDLLPFVVIAALLLGGFALLSLGGRGAQDRLLDRSPMGVAALAPWLSDQGAEARVSHPRLSPAATELSLRVLPLYDTNLNQTGAEFAGAEEQMGSGDQRDLRWYAFDQKVQDLPTLVVLPKWRGAFALTGIAHQQSLIPTVDLGVILRQIGLEGTSVTRATAEFWTEAPENGSSVSLFHAQLFNPKTLPEGCGTVVPFDLLALVVSCPLEGADHLVYFVSDPDVLNNHGLGVGENARFAVDLVSGLRDGDGDIYVDLSPDLLVEVDRFDERQDYERNYDQLARLFSYPFSLLWAALLIVLSVLFWRGAVRFGPIQRLIAPSREQSKRAAIAAKARLLRLSGNDGRLVSDFVRAQLQELATRRFGRDLGQGAEERFLALLARSDPALAKDFGAAARILIDDAVAMPPAQLQRALAQYHTLFSKVVDHHGPV